MGNNASSLVADPDQSHRVLMHADRSERTICVDKLGEQQIVLLKPSAWQCTAHIHRLINLSSVHLSITDTLLQFVASSLRSLSFQWIFCRSTSTRLHS